jgi:hypothetical protein
VYTHSIKQWLLKRLSSGHIKYFWCPILWNVSVLLVPRLLFACLSSKLEFSSDDENLVHVGQQEFRERIDGTWNKKS